MCIIAGYSGEKRAAPILIEMLKKTEFIDGGLSTGIATIHEGKLYMRKVVGGVETLLRETDALNLPGTTGIIHSRTNNNSVKHAHPFTSADENLALVLNGTLRGCGTKEYHKLRNDIMNSFYDRGIEIKSAITDPEKTHTASIKTGEFFQGSEAYALMIGDAVKDSPAETIKDDIAAAAKKTLETLPADVITVMVHANLPDTITVGTVSRPMSIGFGDGETYIATCAIAFPEEIQKNPVMFLPTTTIAQITPDGLNVRSTALDGVRVEPVTSRILRRVHDDIERILTGQKDDPKSIYDFPLTTDWVDMWQKPLVEAKYVLEGSYLKPVAAAIYEVLWSFHKEGRLHSTIGRRRTTNITKFWLD